ncbi:hypothetical protein [Burkholderia glumae]|nr:hypothetical protein [Burkholderia glumae]
MTIVQPCESNRSGEIDARTTIWRRLRRRRAHRPPERLPLAQRLAAA